MKQVPLWAANGSVRAHALVDDEDYSFVMQWRWHLHSKGYAIRSTYSRGKFFLHREIAERVLGERLGRRVVHHGPGGQLDNRRSNLTICADGGEHKRVHHAGGGLGVCLHQQSGRWLAYLDPKPRRYLGLHPTREAALAAVEEARNAATRTS